MSRFEATCGAFVDSLLLVARAELLGVPTEQDKDTLLPGHTPWHNISKVSLQAAGNGLLPAQGVAAASKDMDKRREIVAFRASCVTPKCGRRLPKYYGWIAKSLRREI